MWSLQSRGCSRSCPYQPQCCYIAVTCWRGWQWGSSSIQIWTREENISFWSKIPRSCQRRPDIVQYSMHYWSSKVKHWIPLEGRLKYTYHDHLYATGRPFLPPWAQDGTISPEAKCYTGAVKKRLSLEITWGRYTHGWQRTSWHLVAQKLYRVLFDSRPTWLASKDRVTERSAAEWEAAQISSLQE